MQIELTRWPRALWMYAWNVVGALVRPKGITIYSNRLYLVLNAVFYSSPSLIRNLWYASRRSSLLNTLAYPNLLSSSLISVRGYRFLMVTLLRPR
jgi:hypothetical protein